jgi:hypothetical protein
MLSVYCPRHRATVLLSTSSIVGFAQTSQGFEVAVECTCGERIDVRTGRREPALV